MSKYAERIDGESEQDFRRRYDKIKRRALRQKIYDARTEPVKTRGKNKAPGKNGWLTQEQWEELKIKDGESPEDHKKRYAREIVRLHRARHGEEGRVIERKKARDYCKKYRDKIIERRTAAREAEPERHARYAKKYYEKNKDARLAKLKAWGIANPERVKANNKQWWIDNRGKQSAYSSKRRAAEFKATPLWADYDKIFEIYERCAHITKTTGIEHHVDHFYPLRGKTVSGLHVHTNLRVIPASDNLKKRNHHPDQ